MLVRWSVVAAVVILGLFASLSIEIKENALDLLPGEAVRGDLEKLGAMGLVNRLFITLTLKEGTELSKEEAGQRLRDNVDRLGRELTTSGQFSFVFSHLQPNLQNTLMDHTAEHLPYVLAESDYRKLGQLISPKSVQQKLKNAFMQLNSPVGIGLEQRFQNDPLGMVFLGLEKLHYLRSEFSMVIEQGYFMSRDGRSCLLLAESKHSLTDSAEAQRIQEHLTVAYKRVLDETVEARVIGTLPHTLANSSTVRRDLQTLLPAATGLLILLLAMTLRGVRSIVVFTIPFLAALPAIAITHHIYGRVSGIALGFGIVLLGIGVDFAVHLYLGLTHDSGSLKEKMSYVRKPIIFATLTTTAVFIILHFSAVASHRQMATLAFTGILFAVTFSWLLIPTIISKKNEISPQLLQKHLTVRQPPGAVRKGKIALLVWGMLILFGICTWPQLKYNGDLRVLDVPNAQVKKDENFFSKTWGEKTNQLFIITEGSLGQTLDRNSSVAQFLLQQGYESFQSFAPLFPGARVRGENLARWQAFWDKNYSDFEPLFIQNGQRFGFRPIAFEPFLTSLKSKPQPFDAEEILQGPLQTLFKSMLKRSREESHSNDGGKRPYYFALTTVAAEGDKVEALVEQFRDTNGITVIANSEWRKEVERLLRYDIILLSSLAGLVIVCIVALQFKNMLTVVAVLAPVLSALSAMSIFCYLTKGQLNMMHLIMGIMVIGLSVDYGIFTVCGVDKKINRCRGNSLKAVSICAASSLIGFGVLVFAQHPALHALGVTVMVGIGVAWPTALVVTPSLLSMKKGIGG